MSSVSIILFSQTFVCVISFCPLQSVCYLPRTPHFLLLYSALWNSRLFSLSTRHGPALPSGTIWISTHHVPRVPARYFSASLPSPTSTVLNGPVPRLHSCRQISTTRHDGCQSGVSYGPRHFHRFLDRGDTSDPPRAQNIPLYNFPHREEV